MSKMRRIDRLEQALRELFRQECEKRSVEDLEFFADNGYWPENANNGPQAEGDVRETS